MKAEPCAAPLSCLYQKLLVSNSEKFSHFLVLETLAGNVGLDPLPVQHKLRNGPFTGSLDHFFGRTGYFLYVDFFVVNVVLGQPAFSNTAVAAPWGCINCQFHI